MKKKAIDDVLKEDALMREAAVDAKNEKLQNLWDKYGMYIIIAVALILTVTVSFETFKAWKNKKDQELSNAYAVAVSLQSQGRYNESLDILQNLAKSGSIYSDIARLQIANLLFDQNKDKEAMETLSALVEDDDVNPQIREISIVKLASYKLDTDTSSEDIRDLLSPLADDESSWAPVAHELLAMLAIRDGDIDTAKTEYEKVISFTNVQDGLKNRAQDMLSIINSQK